MVPSPLPRAAKQPCLPSPCLPQVRRMLPMAAEFASPMWVFGQAPYHVLSSGQILAVYSDPTKAGELGRLRRAGCFEVRLRHVQRCPALTNDALRSGSDLLARVGWFVSVNQACLLPARSCPLPPPGSTLALIDPASGGVAELDTPFSSYSGPTLAVHEVGLKLLACHLCFALSAYGAVSPACGAAVEPALQMHAVSCCIVAPGPATAPLACRPPAAACGWRPPLAAPCSRWRWCCWRPTAWRRWRPAGRGTGRWWSRLPRRCDCDLRHEGHRCAALPAWGSQPGASSTPSAAGAPGPCGVASSPQVPLSAPCCPSRRRRWTPGTCLSRARWSLPPRAA